MSSELFPLLVHAPPLKYHTSSYIFGVISFLCCLVFWATICWLVGSKRLLGHSSLQGYVSTAVLVWPVNLRIIAHSVLQANLSCSLERLVWLGFASCLLLPSSVWCFPVEPLCCSHALLPLTPPRRAAASWATCYVLKLLALPCFPRSLLLHCRCLGLISPHLSLVWVTCRTWIWLKFSTFGMATWWLS